MNTQGFIAVFSMVLWSMLSAEQIRTFKKCAKHGFYPNFYLGEFRCEKHRMINIESAAYHGPAGSRCKLQHYDTQLKKTCNTNLDCQLSMPYRYDDPFYECIQCITVTYSCVKAYCDKPDVPVFGYTNVTQSKADLGATVKYTCEPGFNLRGHPTRTCGLVRHIYYGTHLYYRYMWYNVTAPKCIADVSHCPRNAQSRDHPIGTYEGNCYEFVHEHRTWEAARDDCATRNASLVKRVSSEAYQSIVDTTPPLNTSQNSAFGSASHGTFWIDRKTRGQCVATRLYFHSVFGNYSVSKIVDCSALNYYICEYSLVPAPSCDILDAVENGMKSTETNTFGSVIVFTCRYGYKLLGSASRKCMHNGLWSGNQPQCELIDCGPPPVNNMTSQRMTVNYTSTIFQSVVNYTCKSGYYLHGSSLLVCSVGEKWYGEAPTCELFPPTVAIVTSTPSSSATITDDVDSPFTRHVPTATSPRPTKPRLAASQVNSHGNVIAAAIGIPVILCVLAIVVIMCLLKWGLLPCRKRVPKTNLSSNAMENPLYATFHGEGQLAAMGLANPVYESVEDPRYGSVPPTLSTNQRRPNPAAPPMSNYVISANDDTYPGESQMDGRYNPVYETLENYRRQIDQQPISDKSLTLEATNAHARLSSGDEVSVKVDGSKTTVTHGLSGLSKDPADTTY